MKTESADVITEKLSAALHELLESGWELPFYAAIVGSNGFAHFYQFVPDEAGSPEPKLLAQHEVGQGVDLPINMMFVNRDGRAARLLIEKSGEWGMIHLAGNA